MNFTEARNHSYWINKVAVPAVLVTTQDTYSSGDIPAGSKISVLSISNAGFNGMTVFGRYADRYVHISAGYLRKV